jgi:hypothetical protein
VVFSLVTRVVTNISGKYVAPIIKVEVNKLRMRLSKSKDNLVTGRGGL